MNVCIVGGSGFIGTHLINTLVADDAIKKIIVIDMLPPQVRNTKIQFFKNDIRSAIHIDQKLPILDVCIHLAALCKEPGYPWEDYFETNYIGTKNVLAFLDRQKVRHILFTSTMMVYKAGDKCYSEEDLTAPDTAYGMSKLLAEEVLLNWKNMNKKRNLKIVRAGVVFGKGENGNFTRLTKALKRNLFVYVGKKDTIKGSIYVKEVVRFLNYLVHDNGGRVIYNFVFPEPDTIQKICRQICSVMGWRRYIPVLPFKILMLISYIFEFLNTLGVRNPIHHRRIEKLYYSTYLAVDSALNSGYRFKYTFTSAIEDWKKECDNKGLY